MCQSIVPRLITDRLTVSAESFKVLIDWLWLGFNTTI